MTKTLITTFITDVSHLNEKQIELAQALYLAGLPPEVRGRVSFDVEYSNPPSFAERMLYHIRREHEEQSTPCHHYRSKKSSYVRRMGEQ